ncbi:MAG TPA: Asp23/Gls24 family envelope stress response protein [Gaiellaceae bacterium]|nr:Asp23/Gls24 family envelope stress response protein [Gaiellaceae bacterium]
MEGNASVATDVVASYAADAAREVEGVAGLVEGRLPRQSAVRIGAEDGVTVELHVALAWGAAAQEVGAEVQQRVADYLERMAGSRPRSVDVVVDEIAAP